MAFDGNGNYVLPSPEYPFIPNTLISAEDMNNILADIAGTLGSFLSRQGDNGPITAIDWKGQKITGLGNGTAAGDAVNFGQVFVNGVFTNPTLKQSPPTDSNGLQIPSTEWVRTLAINAALPGQTPAVAGFFLQTNGTTANFVSIDGRGFKYAAKGNSGVTPVVINHQAGEVQSLTITGATTISFTGWPADRAALQVLKLTNAGAFPPAFTGIVWIKSDGSETANFAETNVVWQTSGRDRLIVCVDEPGATPWAKVVR